MKYQRSRYGYKLHINADRHSKLVRRYAVTPANVNDTKAAGGLVDKADRRKKVCADKGYTGTGSDIRESGALPRIMRRPGRGRPLTGREERYNRAVSQVRARVEHVFGHIKTQMKGLFIRSIGSMRAQLNIGMMSLTYNLSRAAFLLERQGRSVPV